MKDKLAKMIDVKSIVTLAMTAALITLLVLPKELNKELLAVFCTSYGSIITYFFTKKEGN